MLITHVIRDHNGGTSYVPASLNGDSANGVWKYVGGERDQNVVALGYKVGGAVFSMNVQGSVDGGVIWHTIDSVPSTSFDSAGAGWIEVPAWPLMRIQYAYTSGTNTSFDAWIIE